MLNEADLGPRQQLRQPRLAEMVAAALRKRIVSGGIEDGGMLPKQEDLMAEFGISLPPMREALRILETEGLITVRRGNTGGAVVHQPQATKAAYMLGLVLQSRDVQCTTCSTPSAVSSPSAPPPAPPAPTGKRLSCPCCGPPSTLPLPPSTTASSTPAWPASSTPTSWPAAATPP